MTLSLVTVTGTFIDGSGNPHCGNVTFSPSDDLIDVTGEHFITGTPVSTQMDENGMISVLLVATDNLQVFPDGWLYNVAVTIGRNTATFTTGLPSSPSTVDITALMPAGFTVMGPNGSSPVGATLVPYLPAAGGTLTGKLTLDGSTPLQIPAGAAAGDVLTSDASGNASWSAGAVPGLAASLYSEVARAETAEGGLAANLTSEVTRAQAAEGGLASNLSSEVARAQTAEAANAGAITTETARAEAAETLALQKGNNLADLASASSARTNLGLTGAATAPLPLAIGSGGTGATSAGSWPTLNQNTTGTAAGLSSTLAIGSGGTGSSTRNFAGLLTPTAVKTFSASPYAAAAGDFVPVDTTSGNVTITLPNAPADLTVVAIKHVIQGGTNTVTFACAGSDVFNKTGGATTGTLTLASQGVLLQYRASGAIWYVMADDLPLSQLDNRYLRNGPVPSGDVTGATDAANLAAASAAAGAWTTIVLEAGTYYVSSTVLTSNTAGVMFRGQGKLNTIITPVGTGMNGISVFKFVNCRNGGCEQMWIKGNSTSGQVPLAGIESQANNPTTVPSTNLIVKDCFIGGTSANSLTYGIAWTLVSDLNNDEGYIENVDIYNTSTSCLYVGHLNSLQHKIIGGSFAGQGAGITFAGGGSVACFGTAFGNPGYVVDMGAGTYTHPTLLSAAQCEGPLVWIRSNSAASNANLFLTGCDFNSGSNGATMIDWAAAGMLSASSCNMNTGQPGTIAQFTDTGAHSGAVFTGCKLGISQFSWYSTLSMQSNIHLPGAVTMTQQSGAQPVYQPNDIGGGFSPFIFFKQYLTSGSQTLPPGTYELTCVGAGAGGAGAGSMAEPTLTTALTSGAAVTSLAVTALPIAVASGHSVVVTSGANTQTFTASATAAISATSISVTSLNANFSYPIGSTVYDSSWTQAGAGSGSAGSTSSQFAVLSASTALTITVGAGGANGTGGAAGGNPGTNGTFGASTSITGTGVSVIAAGGSPGRLSAASSATAALGGTWGTGNGNGTTAGLAMPGSGAGSGLAGTGPVGNAGGGGGGGGPATATLGGGGGTAGSLSAVLFAAGASGASGTAAGVAGGTAAANTGSGGGGGGGGATTGAGGNGGTGGSGFATIQRLA